MITNTKSLNVFVLSARYYNRVIKNGPVTCRKCDKEIKLGEEVVSNTRYRGISKKYHLKCYESLFL